jgi:hypothetical protein
MSKTFRVCWGNSDYSSENCYTHSIHLLTRLHPWKSNKTVYHSIAQTALYGSWKYFGEWHECFNIICTTRTLLSTTLKLVWGNSDQLNDFTWGNSDHASYFSWTLVIKALALTIQNQLKRLRLKLFIFLCFIQP